jgi:hypothetical protein
MITFHFNILGTFQNNKRLVLTNFFVRMMILRSIIVKIINVYIECTGYAAYT